MEYASSSACSTCSTVSNQLDPELCFWDEDSVPTEDDKGFQDLIQRDARSPDATIFRAEDGECSEWLSHPDRYCTSLFGDHVTTATTNAFGHLIQFGTYLGAGRSGMFCADQEDTAEPCLVRSRAIKLDEFSRECDEGMYANVSVQWMIHDGIVMQQYIVDNLGTGDMKMLIKFGRDMCIRDLDVEDSDYGFNEDSVDKNHMPPGPNSYSWICVHTMTPSGDGGTGVGFESIAVVVSIFLNGTAVKWNNGPEWHHAIKGRGSQDSSTIMEVVVAYRMVRLTNAKIDWTRFLIPVKAVGINQLL
ncbi:Uu.00g021320.m01.CDS01 [Anthostomella pinea]|uniref:Uu.00g021320.m01.CDS01 n=1 Tax=Anthostomella pinea TaxID=933095 RepID=A0AAI8YQU3_9PEZI|nr:Uu.00g021320.m01.CDS01 [Anthostomella pinea]